MKAILPSYIDELIVIQSNEATLIVNVQYKVYPNDWEVLRDENVKLPTNMIDTELIKNPAYVSAGVSVTKSPKAYESLKISTMVTLPCVNTEEERNKAMAEAAKIAGDALESQFSEWE